MFGFGPATRIYVAVGATDMRKNYEGLYGWCVTVCNARR